MIHTPLTGLTAATHSPFDEEGGLNLDAVERQAAHLEAKGVSAAFICGTTGESHSLTFEERRALAERWMEVTRGSRLRVVVHVGSNCLADAQALAAQAEKLGAAAIAACPPSYFKPRSLDMLIKCAAKVAGAAGSTPFYYYDIPSLTGVNFPMPRFLADAPFHIPSFAGIKFTSSDLMAYQLCVREEEGGWDIPFGCDEFLLAALSVGAKGAVGSSYNFAAPIYLRMIAAVERGDLAAAREEQFRSVQVINLMSGFGYMAAAKAVMEMLGVPVGGPRLPHESLGVVELAHLRGELWGMGFFEWVR